MFEVDLRQGELRKNGIRVKLTGQPFQILAILLEHPGDLVTREQLQSRLWPSDTFVDFDGGLNAAINLSLPVCFFPSCSTLRKTSLETPSALNSSVTFLNASSNFGCLIESQCKIVFITEGLSPL